MNAITATRYHDFSAGHRVHGHESKCAQLHGHNYRAHFTVEADSGLDSIGRVLDFSAIKERLCEWLESNWDHRFLAWNEDPVMRALNFGVHFDENDAGEIFEGSVVWVPFNPTAENMAKYLVECIGPQQLAGTGVTLVSVCIEETRKCAATYTRAA